MIEATTEAFCEGFLAFRFRPAFGAVIGRRRNQSLTNYRPNLHCW